MLSKKVAIDTKEFDVTMLKYIKASKKTIPEALNQKAYWVVKRAIPLTRKTAKGVPGKFLSVSKKKWKLAAPTVVKTYNLQKGGPHYGKWTRKEMVAKLRKFRNESIGYLRSGWLPAIWATYKWARGRKSFKGVRARGRPMGWARLASHSWSSKTVVCNKTGQKRGQQDAARKYVRPAMQLAINKERQSMEEYIIKKQVEALKKAGAGRNLIGRK